VHRGACKAGSGKQGDRPMPKPTPSSPPPLPPSRRTRSSNPSSPYGLPLLPLAPEEIQAIKATAESTPRNIAKVGPGGGGA
jgi:hypothetical protein